MDFKMTKQTQVRSTEEAPARSAMKLALVVAITALSGCYSHTDATGQTTISAKPIDKEETTSNDQCLRARLFEQCLKALPAGPEATKYNDWDEVVAACESAAYYQSLRAASTIKPECRP